MKMVKFKGETTKKFHLQFFVMQVSKDGLAKIFPPIFQLESKYLIQVLIGLIQVNYGDAQVDSPFNTRCTTMSSFILVLVAQVYAKYFLEIIQQIPNMR
jgi:hypothetical protein